MLVLETVLSAQSLYPLPPTHRGTSVVAHPTRDDRTTIAEKQVLDILPLRSSHTQVRAMVRLISVSHAQIPDANRLGTGQF